MADDQSLAITVDGRLCVWRVFELSVDYTDRQKDGSGDQEFSISLHSGDGNDRLRVQIGTFPGIVRDSERELRARIPYFLNSLFMNAYEDMTISERDAVLESFHEETDLGDLEIGDSNLYLTIEVSRPRLTRVNPQFRFLWVNDHELEARESDRFSKAAAVAIDSALAMLLSAHDPTLQIARVILRDNRPVLIVPEKAAFRIPHLTASAGRPGIQVSGWDDKSWQSVTERLQRYGSQPGRVNDILSSSSRWLSLAMGEKDNVRKFLFAYFGLEVLANKFISHSRQNLAKTLAGYMPGIPVEELIWPYIPDENAPHRNLVFAFAAMATLVSADSAIQDTDQFRRVAKSRNKLAHGDAENLEGLPADEAISLLERYIAEVANKI